MNKHVDVLQAEHLGIEDFFHYNSSITHSGNSEFSHSELRDFVEKTVKATSIKNTFVHHEFKFTHDKKLKTIELNGRI